MGYQVDTHKIDVLLDLRIGLLLDRVDGDRGGLQRPRSVRNARHPRVTAAADLMIVAGRVSQMAPVLRQMCDQMPEPKWVISTGACASTGGMFNNHAIVQGADEVVPVNVYVPGCPPGPQSLMHASCTCKP